MLADDIAIFVLSISLSITPIKLDFDRLCNVYLRQGNFEFVFNVPLGTVLIEVEHVLDLEKKKSAISERFSWAWRLGGWGLGRNHSEYFI